MSDIQLAINPTRAYDCQTVLDCLDRNASYRAHSPSRHEVEASIQGLNRYFVEHCRETTRVRRGRDMQPSKEFSA